MLAISICRLEKYFASIRITTSFMGSTGCKAKAPKLNQLCAPLKTLPTTNKRDSILTDKTKSITTTLVFFKKLQFTTLATRKITTDTDNQITCLSKNLLFIPKEFILTSPARDIKTTQNNKIQSTSLNIDEKTRFAVDKNMLFGWSVYNVYNARFFDTKI